MSRSLHRLTAAAVNAAKPREKAHALPDGGGLLLWVSPKGARVWRYRYRWQGLPKTLSLGGYPDLSLAEARDAHKGMRKLLAKGIDPSAHRQAERRAHAGADTFEVVAREYLATLRDVDRKTVAASRRRLELFVFPKIGRRPVAEITAADILKALRVIEDSGKHETAHRVRALIGRVMRYAVATERAERNVTGNLKGALSKVNATSFAAITEPKAFGGLLRAIDSYPGHVVTRLALQVLALTFVRPGELRLAVWPEFDLDGGSWVIPAERTKLRREHIVPLSTQSVGLLREVESHRLSDDGYAFPSTRKGRPLSDATLNSALRTMGYSGDVHTGHGFRSSASTLLHERGFNDDVIEQQLAHKRPGVGGIYNRAHLLAERRVLMQAWADYIDGLRADTATI